MNAERTDVKGAISLNNEFSFTFEFDVLGRHDCKTPCPVQQDHKCLFNIQRFCFLDESW